MLTVTRWRAPPNSSVVVATWWRIRFATTFATVELGAGKIHQELIASVARHEIDGTAAPLQGLCHHGKRTIASLMAEAIVYRLQSVDVHDQQRESVPAALRPIPFFVQEPGERLQAQDDR